MGFLYLSVPSENTVNLPKGRAGILNYFDDPTNNTTQPNPEKIISFLNENDFEILKVKK